MGASKSITVVGSLNMDMILHVDALPKRGETVLANELHRLPGGKGANQAVAAGRIGADVHMIGRVGADDHGRDLLKNLRETGVNTQGVIVDESGSTGVAWITVEESGQNTICVYSGVNSHLSAADVQSNAELVQQSAALVAQLEIPIPTVQAALQIAKDGQVATILNPAPAQALSPEILELVDVIIPNETELELLTGKTVNDLPAAQQAAQLLLRRGVKQVIVTLGSRGALYVSTERTFHVPALRVEAVDATAAGDAFVAAFAYTYYCAGRSLEEAIDFACRVGALTVTKLGAQASLPYRHEVEAFYGTCSPE